MIKDTWHDVLLWNSLISVVAFVAICFSGPITDNNVIGYIKLFISIFVVSFFVLNIYMVVVRQIKLFKEADRAGKAALIFVIIIALAYVLPKAIKNFTK